MRFSNVCLMRTTLQLSSVNEDIEAKKLTVQQAMVLVWDRNKWKHQVAASSSLK